MKKILFIVMVICCLAVMINTAIAAQVEVVQKFYAEIGDGHVESGDANWSTAHDATTGDSADAGQTYVTVQASLAGNYYIKRAFFPTDTSGLPDNAVVSAATFNGYWQVDLGGPYDSSGGLVLVQTSQSSTDSLVVADFNFTFTSGGTHAYPSPPEWVVINFNSIALEWISKTSFTKVGVVMNKDFDNSVPAELYQGGFRSSEYEGTDYDPYLEITYTCDEADAPAVGGDVISVTPVSGSVAGCSIQGDIIDIASIADINGSGYPETLTLGVDFSNAPVVCIADVNDGFIKEILFFSAGWTPKSVYVVSDMSSPADGIEDISVMAVDTDTGQAKSQIKDTDSDVLIKEVILP